MHPLSAAAGIYLLSFAPVGDFWRELRSKNPPSLGFSLRISDDRQYRERELMRAEAVFPALNLTADPSLAQRWQFGGFLLDPQLACGSLERPCFSSPGLGLDKTDPLLSFGERREPLRIFLNSYLPPLPSGRYRVAALARKLILTHQAPMSVTYGYAMPAEYVVSNELEIEVIPASPEWTAQQIASSVSLLKTEPRNPGEYESRRAAAHQLRWLDLGDDVAEVGIGGTGLGSAQSLAALDPETRDRLVGARGDIDKLLRQARLQKREYEEILAVLEAGTEGLRTTPSLRPVNVGFVSSRYGWRMEPITGQRTMHRGVDYSARMGTPVHATADGVVTFPGVWQTYGNVVEISHGDGFVTRHPHLQRRLVQKGQRVTRGDVIARVGSTGRSTFSHLHYEIERQGERVDPLRYVLAD